jgi:hypothetical protein
MIERAAQDASMKGFTHFISALAAATFFPEVVQAAARGAIWPALAGIAALLPDALDFRLARWLEQPDLSVDFEADPPDPGVIAEGIVAAVAIAWREGRAVRLMLHTLRLGPDAWRRYRVRFDIGGGAVEVEVGPVVNTGGRPIPGSEGAGGRARRPLPVPVRYDYDPEITVDVFSGPSLAFCPEGEAVRVEFLPWHRAWSHSLVLAAVFGMGVGAIGGGWPGVMVGLGYALHIVEDQLGWMGSNLFWPFTRRRIPGLRWMRSVDPWPNFSAVWLSLILMLWNLDRFAGAPRLPAGFPLVGLLVPLLIWAVRRHPALRLPEAPEEEGEPEP